MGFSRQGYWSGAPLPSPHLVLRSGYCFFLDTGEGCYYFFLDAGESFARLMPLEKETATHSSVLVWRIPGTGEPGGLPSMGLHRVGHD